MVRLSRVKSERNSKLHLRRFHLQLHRNGEREIAATAGVILLVKKRRERKKKKELSSALSVEKAFGVSFRGRQ